MDAMQLKMPRLKTPMSASFSRLGRRTLRIVVMGRSSIHMSMRIWVELVTVALISECGEKET